MNEQLTSNKIIHNYVLTYSNRSLVNDAEFAVYKSVFSSKENFARFVPRLRPGHNPEVALQESTILPSLSTT